MLGGGTVGGCRHLWLSRTLWREWFLRGTKEEAGPLRPPPPPPPPPPAWVFFALWCRAVVVEEEEEEEEEEG